MKQIDELVSLIRNASDEPALPAIAPPNPPAAHALPTTSQTNIATTNIAQAEDAAPTLGTQHHSSLIRQLTAPSLLDRKSTRVSSTLSDNPPVNRQGVDASLSPAERTPQPNTPEPNPLSRPLSPIASAQVTSDRGGAGVIHTVLSNAQRISFGALLILELHGMTIYMSRALFTNM